MQLLCSVLCEVYIIHINGFVRGIIEIDRFIIVAVARTVVVKVVSAYLLKLQDFRSLWHSYKIHFPGGIWNTSYSLAQFLCIFLYEFEDILVEIEHPPLFSYLFNVVWIILMKNVWDQNCFLFQIF